MQQTDIVIYRILILGILGLAGYIFGKTRYLPENSDMFLSKFIIKFTTPALILTTLASYNFTTRSLVDGFTISGLAIVFLLLAFSLGNGICRLLRLKEGTAKVYQLQSMLGNVGFLGLPLLGEVFGKKGLVYAMFYVMPHDIILWTLGIYILSKKEGSRKDNLRNLINPNTVAYAIGLVFIVVNFQGLVEKHKSLDYVYKLMDNAFSPLAGVTVYLTMIFIGLTLSKIEIGGLSSLLSRYPTYILTFQKLIVMPLAAYALLYPFRNLVDPFVRTVVILELAMPCSILITTLATQYKSDFKFATENVFFSTLFTIATLPLIMYLISLAG